MKVRIYEKNQLSYFPMYAYTTDIDYVQSKMTRHEGYHAHQIFLVSDGNGILHIGGETFVLNTNDFFYIEKDVPHEYYGTDKNFSTTYLSFFGDGFENIKKYYKLKKYGVYKSKNRGSFEALAKSIFDAFNTAETSVLCSLAFSCVVSFFDEVCKKEYSPIEEVFKYIEENYSKAVTLDNILSFYPYSKAKLCREFKAKYNSTVFEVLTDIRLRNARHMIKANPKIKLESIASSCGFNDVSYFCKMYKRRYGCTPKSKLLFYRFPLLKNNV